MLKLEIIGNLGADAEKKNDKLFFQVAVSQGENNTQWVGCFKKWESGHDAYLKKGTKVFVRGLLSTSIFEKADKTQVVSLSISVDELELLSSVKSE